jgi:hypothetical protein
MMMRFWREEYGRPERRGPGTAMSVVVHGGLIFLAVLATNPPAGLVSLWDVANRVFYLAPTPRLPPSDGSVGALKYVDDAPTGTGSGFGQSKAPAKQATTSPTPGDLGTQFVAIPESQTSKGSDSVFSIVDVDSAARTDPTSAAPVYPDALRNLGIEGSVSVRYVVDSTGFADPLSLVIVHASRVEFAVAVMEALPSMHFVPAKIGQKRVRQLVEQSFNFKIQKPKVDSLAPPKKPPFVG